MWHQAQIKALADAHGLPIEFYGRTGDEAVADVERRLGLSLNDELREFGRNIGAVRSHAFDLCISGLFVTGAEQSCAAVTLELWREQPETRQKVVVIGSWYENLFCWIPGSDCIRQYYDPCVIVEEPEEEWASLADFVAAILPRLRDAVSDGYEIEYLDENE